MRCLNLVHFILQAEKCTLDDLSERNDHSSCFVSGRVRTIMSPLWPNHTSSSGSSGASL